MIRLAKLNHYDYLSPLDFELAFNKWKKSLDKKTKFHTEFYFELN